MKNKAIGLIALTAILTPLVPQAFAFNDVPVDHMCYEETAYFEAQDYIQSAELFNPETEITRAAALKIIFKATEDTLPQYNSEAREYPYSDVPADAWFAQYVEYAADQGIIGWEGETSLFNPSRSVNRAEFMKMTLKAFGQDPTAHSLTKNKAKDVEESSWYAPFVNFFLHFNILKADESGNAYPSKAVTRCDGVKILFRLLEAGKGLDTQTLLNISEASIVEAFSALEGDNVALAGYLSVISEHFVKRAVHLYPQNEVVRSADKVTESLKFVIGAYSAGKNGLKDEAITASQKAWALANEAEELSTDENIIAQRIKQMAHDLAKIAREE